MAFDDTKGEHSGHGTNWKGKGKKKGGGKAKDDQDPVVDVTALKKGMPKAIKVMRDMQDAQDDANAFFEKFSDDCGIEKGQLKSAAKAYAKEQAEAKRRKAEQMQMIFQECGA